MSRNTLNQRGSMRVAMGIMVFGFLAPWAGADVTVTPTSGNSFGPIYKDRITPVADRLSCKDVDGEPDVDLAA